MQIIWNINTLTTAGASIVSLGTFDGVHRGHQAILQELQLRAQQTGACATMVTFEPHPQLVLQPMDRKTVGILTTIEEKIKILNDLGLDRLVVAHFSPAFAEMNPHIFVEKILLRKLQMRQIIIGHDHAFGINRSGNLELLQKLAQINGFTVDSLSPLQLNGKIISSTLIREYLSGGDIDKANKLLGRPYSISGMVVHGHGTGKSLGYPTINLRPYSQYKLIPYSGIYASKTYIAGQPYKSVTYIGTRPTYGHTQRVIESYLLDFKNEVYGQEVDIEFIAYIRGDEKFASPEDLVKQISKDIYKSMELLEQQPS